MPFDSAHHMRAQSVYIPQTLEDLIKPQYSQLGEKKKKIVAIIIQNHDIKCLYESMQFNRGRKASLCLPVS